MIIRGALYAWDQEKRVPGSGEESFRIRSRYYEDQEKEAIDSGRVSPGILAQLSLRRRAVREHDLY